MKNQTLLDDQLETIAWGLRWWILIGLPDGTGLLGTGLILLGLNGARALNKIQTRGFTTLVGLIAFGWGGVDLVNTVLTQPFKLPFLAILLIAVGAIMLICELNRVRLTKFGN